MSYELHGPLATVLIVSGVGAAHPVRTKTAKQQNCKTALLIDANAVAIARSALQSIGLQSTDHSRQRLNAVVDL